MNSKYRMIEVEARNIDDMVSELLEYKSRRMSDPNHPFHSLLNTDNK